MADFKYEPRPYPPRFREVDSQNNFENAQIQHPMMGYYSTYEDTNFGGSGDRLFDLECQIATSLSKELLNALDAPTQRPLPDYERNKVACLKNAILELKKENDELHRELLKADKDEHTALGHSRTQTDGAHGVNETIVHRTERNVGCQTESQSFKGRDRSSKFRRSGSESIAVDPRKNNLQAPASSHSKCVDWLSQKKSLDDKRDDLDFVRLALWQLWELADCALTHNSQPKHGFPVLSSENITKDETENEKDPEGMDCPSNEIDQLRLQLARLTLSKDRMKRRRDEQALLLRQKEIQVSRLQRSRHNLMHTFKSQLLKLRQQQALELKALRLEMQTERASSLAGQTALLEDQLQCAVEQLEERYRGLLRDAFNDISKNPSRSPLPASTMGQHSREENGT